MNETLNTVRYLIGDTEATALLSAPESSAGGRQRRLNRRFPPLQAPTIIGDELPQLERIADHVASYVLANFATVTGCPTATDACATTYLDKLAARAYRRPLTSDEQSRFTALYTKLRSAQTVNGYEVTFTVEEATSYAVHALLSSPQMLWRWELGDPAMASTAPAGIPLTDDELATHLVVLPDRSASRRHAAGGGERGNAAREPGGARGRAARVASRPDWLRTIIETYLQLNSCRMRRSTRPGFRSSRRRSSPTWASRRACSWTTRSGTAT